MIHLTPEWVAEHQDEVISASITNVSGWFCEDNGQTLYRVQVPREGDILMGVCFVFDDETSNVEVKIHMEGIRLLACSMKRDTNNLCIPLYALTQRVYVTCLVTSRMINGSRPTIHFYYANLREIVRIRLQDTDISFSMERVIVERHIIQIDRKRTFPDDSPVYWDDIVSEGQ